MFGLKEDELSLYVDLAQSHAVEIVTPTIMAEAEIIAPAKETSAGEKPKADMKFVQHVVSDIEKIVTLVAVRSAYEYAYLQTKKDVSEKEVINTLHKNYETYTINQFISYGVSFGKDVIDRILGEIIIELPYLYIASIEDEMFDEDKFLEDSMEAYEEYLINNFPEYKGEKDIEDILDIYEEYFEDTDDEEDDDEYI